MSAVSLPSGTNLVNARAQKIQSSTAELKRSLQAYLLRPIGRHSNEVPPSKLAIARRSLEALCLIESAMQRVGVIGGDDNA
jgi:hypothetical protein